MSLLDDAMLKMNAEPADASTFTPGAATQNPTTTTVSPTNFMPAQNADGADTFASPAAAPAPVSFAPTPTAAPAATTASLFDSAAASPAYSGGGEGGSSGNGNYSDTGVSNANPSGTTAAPINWAPTAPTTGTLQANGLPAWGDLTNQWSQYFGPLNGQDSATVNIPGLSQTGDGSLPIQRIYAQAPTQDQYTKNTTSGGEGGSAGTDTVPDEAAYQTALAQYNATPEWARYAYRTNLPSTQLDGHTNTYYVDPTTGQTMSNGYDFKNSPSFLLDKLYPAVIQSAIAGIAGAGIGGAIGSLGTAGSTAANTGLAAGEFGLDAGLGGQSALLNIGSNAAAAATAASAAGTTAGGAATVLPGVTVTGALGGSTAGAAAGTAAGATSAALDNGVTQNADGSQTGQAVQVTGNATPTSSPVGVAAGTASGALTASPVDGAQVQQGEQVQVTGQKTPDYSTLPNLAATAPVLAQLMMNVPLPQQPAALQAMQQANLNPDQSKWNLSDWQTYLRLASGIAGLLGAGGSGSSSSASAPAATGSNTVPTGGTGITIPGTTTGGQSLADAAAGLQLANTDYSAGANGAGTPAITAPVTAGAVTPQTVGQSGASAGFTSAGPASANLGSVDSNQLVSDQLTKLLASSSPYVDQARQRAIQAANARGLQNSTLAGQSGEEAAIAQGLPIAQQDAATYQKQSLTNQAAKDTADALSENIRESNNATGVQQQSLAEQQRQFNTTTASDSAKLAEDARQFNDTAAQKDRLAQLDTNTQKYLADSAAQYHDQTQASASASDLFNTFQNQVALIATSSTMDAANKQAAIDIASSNLKAGMAVLGSINGLDLSQILQFQGGTTPTASTTAAPAPAPAAAAASLTPAQQSLYQAAQAAAAGQTSAAPAAAPAAAATTTSIPKASTKATTPAGLGVTQAQFDSMTAAGFNPANIDQPGMQSWNPTHQTMRQWLNSGESPTVFLQALL